MTNPDPEDAAENGTGADSTAPLRDDRRGAIISDDGEYRYCLHRIWDTEKPVVAFLMLNPSTADATQDDPTVRRCIGYAREWGYGSLIVGNLFALRTPDPDCLHSAPDPVGPENDAHLASICRSADQVIAAWGSHGSFASRCYEVVEMLDVDLKALNTTQDGHPNHPLYQPADTDPSSFTYDG